MSIITELKAAERECVCMTQEAWENALIKGWQGYWRMSSVIKFAAGISKDRRVDRAMWATLFEKGRELKPPIPASNMSTHSECRAFICNYAHIASEALWKTDDPWQCKNLLKLGGNPPKGVTKRRKSCDELRKVRIVKARALDMSSDWGTVK